MMEEMGQLTIPYSWLWALYARPMDSQRNTQDIYTEGLFFVF